ncbi:MAG: DUF4242 domain-containing protein [Acidimicrobiia bacterium]|nr:DUF4242 domain-containing protein [Acidimicrobiia bacterium]
MPLFMDVHDGIPDEADAEAVAEAHRADLRIQEKYNTRFINYWLDAEARKIFCLVDAPDAETAHTVHREAHGLVADEMYQVEQG